MVQLKGKVGADRLREQKVNLRDWDRKVDGVRQLIPLASGLSTVVLGHPILSMRYPVGLSSRAITEAD